MTKHSFRGCLLGVAVVQALITTPAVLAAQMLPGTGWAAGAGAAYETYRFDTAEAVGIQDVSLFTVPFAARAALFRGSSVTVSGSFAEGTLTRPGGSSTSISGLTDTDLRLDVPMGRDAVVLTAIVALPTGQARQTLEEAEVAGVFAADLLPFRVSNWGTGGAFGLATSFARSFGATGVGFSVGYSVAQEYEPLAEDERAYRPGNELRLRFALDHSFGRAAKASMQLGMQRYDDDVLGGQNLYQSGNRYQAIGSLAFAAGARASGALYAGVSHRDQGTFLDVTREAPAQDLILAGAGLRMPMGRAVFLPGVDGRVFRSADGVGQGYATGVGAAMELPLGGLTLVPSLRGRFGNVIAREDAESGFTGLDAGLMVRFGGAVR